MFTVNLNCFQFCIFIIVTNLTYWDTIYASHMVASILNLLVLYCFRNWGKKSLLACGYEMAMHLYAYSCVLSDLLALFYRFVWRFQFRLAVYREYLKCSILALAGVCSLHVQFSKQISGDLNVWCLTHVWCWMYGA